MKLLKAELYKLLRAPAILCFVFGCVLLNVIVVLSSAQRSDIAYLNRLSAITGTKYGEAYIQKLQTVPKPGDTMEEYRERDLYEMLQQSAQEVENPFVNWNLGNIKNQLENSKLSDSAIKLLSWKYELLTPEIQAKALRADGDSVYFGSSTNYKHEMLFNNLSKLLLAESAFLLMILMLWALGYEGMAGTDLVVYATKVGRRVIRHKIAAAIFIGSGSFLLLCGVTYALHFALNDVSLIWSQNVSAQYHTAEVRFLGILPFITWESMSVGTHFLAGIGVAYLNSIVMALFAIPFGLLIKNVYTAFCGIAGCIFMNWVAIALGERTVGNIPFVWHLSLMTPLAQGIQSECWFTDGGTSMLLPHFELLYPLMLIVVMTLVSAVCAKKFWKKEIS